MEKIKYLNYRNPFEFERWKKLTWRMFFVTAGLLGFGYLLALSGIILGSLLALLGYFALFALIPVFLYFIIISLGKKINLNN